MHHFFRPIRQKLFLRRRDRVKQVVFRPGDAKLQKPFAGHTTPERMSRHFANALAIILLFCLGVFHTPDLHAGNRIVLKAEAFDEYLKERALDPNKKVQTYQFMKGKYYGGGINDSTMDQVSFTDLVQDLAIHLQKQNFYPEPELEKADLVIVVHYGVTGAQPDSLTEAMGVDSIFDLADDPNASPEQINSGGSASGGTAGNSPFSNPSNVDPGLEFNYNASLSMQEAQYAASYSKAKLLGMEEAYSSKGSRYDEILLNTMIQEERYFVNLLAWDYQKMRQGEQILLWRMRYNVRSTGQSFGTAIAEMNELASDYFGTNHKNLVMKRIDDKSRVEIGEIEVIEQVEE